MEKSEYSVKEKYIRLSIKVSFFSILLLTTLVINRYNNLFFHSSIEMFSCIVFFIVFVFSYNTYSINKNHFLMLLGIGYFFVAIVDMLHACSHPGVSILYEKGNLEIATELWITARYLSAFTCLISTIAIFKPIKKFNIYKIFLVYFSITVLALISIFIFDIFPTCFIIDKGLTNFKIASEYIISFAYVISAYFFFKLKEKINFKVFIYVECFLLISALSDLFFTSFFTPLDWTNIAGHILKAVSSYFLFKSIVETGLKRPFYTISNDLNAANTKLKQFEQILLTNEKCYDFIINYCDNVILVICENKFAFANDRAVTFLGAENANDIIGLEINTVIPESVRFDSLKRINGVLEHKEGIPRTESKILRFDKQVLDVDIINCYFDYHGKPAVLAMLRDISSKKQIAKLRNDINEDKKIIEKTKEFNTMLTEFFSNISHELKTPLNVILGAVQMLSLPAKEYVNTSDNVQTKKYLRTMKQNCYRLIRLVNNLIDISKFDSGYFKVYLNNYNVVSAIEDITLSVADYAKNKGIELIFDTDVEEKYMAIDLDKIERIILNLLSNSIKFTDIGGQILVNVYDKGESILISVKDNGVGMPKDKLNVIFERFGQVEKTLTRNSQGSGIGLSLVKSIVDMHDGDIKVFSEVGKGSEFIIELPVRLVEDNKTLDGRLYESKVEKISIEFSDIYS